MYLLTRRVSSTFIVAFVIISIIVVLFDVYEIVRFLRHYELFKTSRKLNANFVSEVLFWPWWMFDLILRFNFKKTILILISCRLGAFPKNISVIHNFNSCLHRLIMHGSEHTMPYLPALLAYRRCLGLHFTCIPPVLDVRKSLWSWDEERGRIAG